MNRKAKGGRADMSDEFPFSSYDHWKTTEPDPHEPDYEVCPVCMFDDCYECEDCAGPRCDCECGP